MSEDAATLEDPAGVFLALYDDAMPQVYGYLLARCGGRTAAEDLTAETFLAAVAAVRGGGACPVSIPWLIGVARHKLVDHWRREGREDRRHRTLTDQVALAVDPWDAEIDAVAARQTLGRLASQHRAALTLRYVDDLPVPEVAALLGRSVHATEALLVRARAMFRRAYDGPERSDG